MPVMTDALLTNAGRLASADNATVANIAAGAQYGFGNHLPDIDAATPLIMSPIVPIITHAPTMFQYLPNFYETLKALVERMTISITGVDPHYTLQEAQIPAGADGQMLNMPTNARRDQVSPVMEFPELTGNLVWNFFRTWMRMIKDPDTQASSLAGIIPDGTTLSPHVMSMFTMDVLFLQYDTTLQPQNLIDAYFVTNMWPNDIGNAGYQKSTVGESHYNNRTINFHGVLQHNRNTRVVGQNIAEVLQLHRYNYDFATPVATDIESMIQNTGLQAEVAEIASAFGPMGGNAAVA